MNKKNVMNDTSYNGHSIAAMFRIPGKRNDYFLYHYRSLKGSNERVEPGEKKWLKELRKMWPDTKIVSFISGSSFLLNLREYVQKIVGTPVKVVNPNYVEGDAEPEFKMVHDVPHSVSSCDIMVQMRDMMSEGVMRDYTVNQVFDTFNGDVLGDIPDDEADPVEFDDGVDRINPTRKRKRQMTKLEKAASDPKQLKLSQLKQWLLQDNGSLE